jgi:hypothetical protein
LKPKVAVAIAGILITIIVVITLVYLFYETGFSYIDWDIYVAIITAGLFLTGIGLAGSLADTKHSVYKGIFVMGVILLFAEFLLGFGRFL